jgi:ATP-dependent RNA helicase DDX5/DBP2
MSAFCLYLLIFCCFFFFCTFISIGRTGRAGKKGFAVSFFVMDKNGRLSKELIEVLNRTQQVIPPELKVMGAFSSGRGGGGGRGRGGGGGRRY